MFHMQDEKLARQLQELEVSSSREASTSWATQDDCAPPSPPWITGKKSNPSSSTTKQAPVLKREKLQSKGIRYQQMQDALFPSANKTDKT